jgi:hypothetical protein
MNGGNHLEYFHLDWDRVIRSERGLHAVKEELGVDKKGAGSNLPGIQKQVSAAPPDVVTRTFRARYWALCLGAWREWSGL